MSTPTDKERSLVLLGRVLTFNRDPSGFSDEKPFNYWEKGFVVIKNGLISDVGELTKIPDEATVVDYGGFHRRACSLPTNRCYCFLWYTTPGMA